MGRGKITHQKKIEIKALLEVDFRGVPPPTYPYFLSICRIRSQGSRVKISRGLNALWRTYKSSKN